MQTHADAAVQAVLSSLGVPRYSSARTADCGLDTSRWTDAADYAMVLERVGLSPRAVLAVVCEAAPVLAEVAEPELRWGTPEGVYNAVVLMERLGVDIMPFLREVATDAQVAAKLEEWVNASFAA